MQMLMFEIPGKGEAKHKPATPVRVKTDRPAEPLRSVASAVDIDRQRRPSRADEEADRWDGLY